MRRTKFRNVVDLSAARQQTKVDNKPAKLNRRYRLGVMIEIEHAPLTEAELGLCQLIHAQPVRQGIPRSSLKALIAIINRLQHSDVVKIHQDRPGDYRDKNTA